MVSIHPVEAAGRVDLGQRIERYHLFAGMRRPADDGFKHTARRGEAVGDPKPLTRQTYRGLARKQVKSVRSSKSRWLMKRAVCHPNRTGEIYHRPGNDIGKQCARGQNGPRARI